MKTDKRSKVGFTIEQIYSLVGRYDYTTNIDIRKDSEDALLYGNSMVGIFLYTKEEREELELRILNTENRKSGYIKFSCFLPPLSNDESLSLKNRGINSQNIICISWLPSTKTENTYPSDKNRNIEPIIINDFTFTNETNIIRIYTFLKKLIQNKIGLCPSEKNRYLAYKTILEPNELSIEEKKYIYNKGGKMNVEVAFEYFRCMKIETPKDRKKYAFVLATRYKNRMDILNQELEEAGCNLEKLRKENPELLNFLIIKTHNFQEQRYNNFGKHPLFLDLKGYVHILIRHVKESQLMKYRKKTIFQFNERNLEIVMREVIALINKDYQDYKNLHPNDDFSAKKENEYYYNGDYYAININANGSIASFYKRGTLNNRNNESTNNVIL